MNTFGGLLKLRRRELDQTLGDVADNAGMTVSYISAIECGTRLPPKGQKWTALMHALEFDADEECELKQLADDARQTYQLKKSLPSMADEKAQLVTQLLRTNDGDHIWEQLRKNFEENDQS